MFDTILLLTDQVERNFLPPLLKAANPGLDVVPVAGIADLLSVEPAQLARSRLIAFVTNTIVPADVLSLIGHGAFNFHPGPPDYPGWAPVHFALYDQARQFGVTLHVMTEKVDAGPILDVDLFPIAPRATVASLGAVVYWRLLAMFRNWALDLATRPAPLSPRQQGAWSGREASRRRHRSLCDIPLDISEEELQRRLAAFGNDYFGISPSITLHGVEFRLAPKQLMSGSAARR